jgi:hypothetical protein
MLDEVEEVAVPPGSLAGGAGFDDYHDAYRLRLDPNVIPDVDTFARAFTREPPPWIKSLLLVRDVAVGWLGLKRTDTLSAEKLALEADRPIAVGDLLGIFRVFARTEQEILAGADDRHLDFRVSLLVDHDAIGTFGVVSTVVRFHNAIGRAYFTPVRPLHRHVVPAMLRRVRDA